MSGAYQMRWEIMKLEKIINSFIPFLTGAFLIIVVLLTFVQIVMRVFFESNIVWGNDVAQYSMSWMVLIGSIWVTKHNKHLNAGIRLHKKINGKLINLIDGLLALYIACIIAIVTYQTANFCLLSMGYSSMSLDWLKMGFVFIPLPLAMITWCYYFTKRSIADLKKVFHTEFADQAKK
jgi:TRAP-type C4-dicarboxylate transport system permease small subunit